MKKGDKVLIISGNDESGYTIEIDSVFSVSASQVDLSKSTEKFKPTGKNKTKENSAIVLAPDYVQSTKSSSVFARSSTITKIELPKSKIKELLEAVS